MAIPVYKRSLKKTTSLAWEKYSYSPEDPKLVQAFPSGPVIVGRYLWELYKTGGVMSHLMFSHDSNKVHFSGTLSLGEYPEIKLSEE